MRLKTGRRRLLYAVALLLWASGAAWLLAHYWLVRQGAYGPETSPLEPWSLRVHGASAMAALVFAGILWAVHIVRGWQARRGRLTGSLLSVATLLMIVTGYGLYYIGDDDLRSWASLVHWVIGLAALPMFLWHRFSRKPVFPNRSLRLIGDEQGP